MKYKLFANCVVVNGHSRSIVTDLQRENYHIIPLELAEILEADYFDIEELANDYDEESIEEIRKYAAYLMEHELIHEISEHELDFFPRLSTEWKPMGGIENAIIELYNEHSYVFENSAAFFKQLYKSGCRNVEFRLPDIDFVRRNLKELYKTLVSSYFFTVDIFIQSPKPGDVDTNLLNRVVERHNCIRNIFVFNREKTEIIKEKGGGFGGLGFIKGELSPKMCGWISPMYFTLTIDAFTEAHHHNTCLNRKVCIDGNGEIKNCPSMQQGFGNISEVSLSEVIAQPVFQKLWNVKKDEVAKCKDCEFRYCCTDCRAFLDDPSDIYSSPLKCGYDPYNNEWEEWSTNPLKEKAIKFYGLTKLTVHK